MTTLTAETTKTRTIAFIGNPNTGKSTVFNALCGTRQVVGNYPGVTVEKKVGRIQLGDTTGVLVDLPGVYSLNSLSPDEEIAVKLLLGMVEDMPQPDLVLFVLDATNIKRNLLLFSQVIEVGLPIVVVLTMTDLLEREGIELDIAGLQDRLGVPIVPVVGRNKQALEQLRRVLSTTMEHQPAERLPLEYPSSLEQAVQALKANLGPGDQLSDFEIRNLLMERSGRADGLGPGLAEAVEKARLTISKDHWLSISQEASLRYSWADSVVSQVEKRETVLKRFSSKIDRFLIHRVYGLIFFSVIMFLVFQSIYTWAVPFMDFIDGTFGALGEFAGKQLENSPVLASLVTDGIIGGVGAVVIFLPQILILFVFVAILEDSGYLARAAFLMDKLVSWTGLNGRAFSPMLSGFACAVPAIMATRVMPDPKARLSTILVTPLVSCSARLPVYLLLISAFIEPQFGAGWAAFTLFGMHAFGLILAMPIAWFLNRNVLKTPALPFVLEMPTYRMPKPYNVLFRAGRAGKKFLAQAGTIIFACSILVWALSYFPRPDQLESEIRNSYASQLEEVGDEDRAALEDEINQKIAGSYLERSYLGRAGKVIEPVFAPLGFDWKISVGILGAFPAREVIISTLGIIYNLGDVDEESSALKDTLSRETREDGSKVFTPLTAISLMIFFALCSQCMSTLATVKRELNSWKWTAFMFVYMTGLAYLCSFLVYQGGRLLGWS